MIFVEVELTHAKLKEKGEEMSSLHKQLHELRPVVTFYTPTELRKG